MAQINSKRRHKKRAGVHQPSGFADQDTRISSISSANRKWWILGLVFCCSLILKLFFTTGHTYNFDGANHTARVQMVLHSLQNGEFPLWTNRWEQGGPLLQLYPPLFYYLTALLKLLIGNLIFAIKLMAYLGDVLSGITAFLLIEEITEDQQAGFVGGLGFALAPWHIFQILDFGRFTTIFVYAFLPLPFLFFEKYRHGKITFIQAGILTGLSLSLLMAFQYGYALFITVIFIFYLFVNSVSIKKPFLNLQHLLFLVITGVVCVSTSLIFTVPLIGGDKFISDHLSMNAFNVDSATFSSLVTRQDGPILHKGYIGVSFLVLSLFGIASAMRRRAYPLLLMYAFCFYLVLGYDTPFYKYIPFIYTNKATERLILYLILFATILAGEGIKFLKSLILSRYSGSTWTVAFLVLAGICFWDVSVTRNRHWQTTYGMAQVYGNFSKQIAKYKLSQARTFRLIQICSNLRLEWMFELIFPSTAAVETPVSVLGMGISPKKILYDLYGRKWVKSDIESNNKLSTSQNYLYLMNVYYIFYVNAKGQVQIINNPRHTPAVASGSLRWQEDFSRIPQNEETGMIKPLITQMSINQERNSARHIFLMKQQLLPDRPFNINSRLQVLNFEQTINKSFLEIESSHDCYLQLSHSYYPLLHVYVDDKKVPFYETALGLIALPLQMGRHHIRIEPYLPFIRKLSYILNLIFVVLAIVLYRYLKKKRTT